MNSIGISTKAVEQLREELLQKFFEAGLGFRIDVSTNEAGESAFSIRLDRQHQADEAMELDGIRIFLDAASAFQITGYQLDYENEPGGGFFLSTMKEVKSEQN
jgi:Fe-S cluster assembly iron-binding protein IscA